MPLQLAFEYVYLELIQRDIKLQINFLVSIFSLYFQVADQIIEVNGQTFSRISQSEAVRALKLSLINYIANKASIKLTVRYLGKLPLLLTKQPEPLETVQEVSANLGIVFNIKTINVSLGKKRFFPNICFCLMISSNSYRIEKQLNFPIKLIFSSSSIGSSDTCVNIVFKATLYYLIAYN